jgi:hypothetical protein
MSNRAYHTFIEPLILFGNKLNIPEDVWHTYEEPEQIYYSNSAIASNLANSLELECLKGLVDNYQDAITCQFLFGELPLLELDRTIDEQRVISFRAEIADLDSLELIIQIDKQKIIERLFARTVPSEVKVLFHLFNSSLEKFLDGGLPDLEHRLNLERDSKIVFLIAEKTILLEGKYLSVWGGNEIFNLEALTIPNSEEFDRLKQIRLKRLDNLIWQGFELKYFTPLHFEFEQLDNSTNALANKLYNFAVQLILLYIADRSFTKHDSLISIFNSSNKKIEIKVNNYINLLETGDKNNVKALLDLFKWIYARNDTSYDKFSIAQITIVEILQPLDRALYYQSFIAKSDILLADTRYRTKAFVEKKIDDYIQQELNLEDYVVDSIKNFESEIINLIKSISETIKGAITVTIGSFIAAVLGGNFNPLIFRLSLGAYIVYIIIFPFLLTMNNHHYKYELMILSYEERIKRFGNKLDPQKVEKIIGDRFAKIKDKSKWFFWIVIGLYLLVITAGIFAMIYVPNFVTKFQP